MSSPNGISNEEALLLALCRLEFNDQQSEKIIALIHGLKDWNYFLSLANAHGIVALICNNLEKLKLLNAIPGEVSVSLRNSLMKTLSRNEFNMMITGEALQLLNRESIPVVLLKGMALELTVYGNQGIRQMSDVDILIERKQCIKARKILMNNGFKSLPVKSVLHKLILKYVGKHLPSVEKKGVLVEIHHELFGGEHNELTQLFLEQCSKTELRGEMALIPHPRIFFLYLVRHLWLHEKNNESQLRLYTDLVVLLEKYHEIIITDELIEYAVKDGMEEVLASRLKVLKEIWNISFPQWTVDFINHWNDPCFSDRFLFFLKSPKGNPSSDKSWYYRHFVSEIPGFHRKLIFITGDLFPTITFMKRRYKCNSFWKAILYYPHRFGKLLYLFKQS